MYHISKKSTVIMNQLVHGLDTIGAHRRIAANDSFLPVSVEYIAKTEHGLVFSVARYVEQNGNLVQDPKMEFLRGIDGEYYPLGITHGFLGIREKSTTWVRGELHEFFLNSQKIQAAFANEWMRAIKEQHYSKIEASA